MSKTYFCELVLGFSPNLNQNQCRKILWTVNINNYQKKVEISTHCRNGAQKR